MALNWIMPTRKEVDLCHLSKVSAVLHFLALGNAWLGAMRWFWLDIEDSCGFDWDLIAYGFYAYIWDVVTALVFGRSYFYRWTRIDVFIHHLPFMFVGGFWAVTTFDLLEYSGQPVSISYFQQAVRWAMLSCSNEFALALGAALRSEDSLWARLMSTWAGLLYFLVASPVWIYYVLVSCYECYKSSGLITNTLCLWLNTAVPIAYAVTQYPLFIQVYNKRLKKLYEIESYRGMMKKVFRGRRRRRPKPDEEALAKLTDVNTWN
ncbi:hypothetical protein TeGR_g13152, partial [Tetraparma gracilis]